MSERDYERENEQLEQTQPQSQKRYRRIPYTEEEMKQMRNRLNRMAGQLNGIGRMLEENRYCGDVLIQISAVESALHSFGFSLLQSHIHSCVAEDVRQGNDETLDEMMELLKLV